jgi:hypothetical protein
VGEAVGDLALGEVAVAVVHRLELAAVDRDAGAPQHADPTAELDELRAGLADGRAIVAPEIGDGLVVGREAPCQPHQLDVAPGLALQPPTEGNAVQVAVNEELEQDRRVIAWPPRPRRRRPLEPKVGQVQLFNEQIDDAHEMILADPVIQPLGKQRRLAPVDALDEPCHACPRPFRRAYIKAGFPHRLGPILPFASDQDAAPRHPEAVVRHKVPSRLLIDLSASAVLGILPAAHESGASNHGHRDNAGIPLAMLICRSRLREGVRLRQRCR